MARTLRVRRRVGGAAGAPATLALGELAYNDNGDTLDAGNGTAVRRLVGADRQLEIAGAQNITGTKTFTTGALILNPALQTTVNHAATRQYVDDQIAAGQLFRGLWNPVTNTPDISAGGTVHGEYWTASASGVINVAVPVIGGQSVSTGDNIIWIAPPGEWEILGAGGMTQAEADARFLQLAGGTLTGNLIGTTATFGGAVTMTTPLAVTSGGTGVTTGAAALDGFSGATNPDAGALVRSAAGAWSIGTAFPEAPTTAGVIYGRSGENTNWAPVLPITGGTLTGALSGTTLTLTGALTGASMTLTTALPVASGGTGAPTEDLALDSLSGATNPDAGVLMRAAGGTWAVSATGGFPEAPTTAGVIYGRSGENTNWAPVLPLSGGTLTGGLSGTTLTLTGALTGASMTLTTPLALGSGGTGVAAANGGAALDGLSGATNPDAGALTRSAAGVWSIGAAGIPEPGTAGNWLRVNPAGWIEGLPLAGGTLSSVTNVPATSGLGITVAVSDDTWTRAGLRMTVTDGQGIVLSSSGAAFPDLITLTSATPGTAITIASSGGGNAIDLTNSGAGIGFSLNNTGTGNSIQVISGAGAPGRRFIVQANGGVTVGAAGGLAPGPGDISIAGGYLVNGVPLGLDAISGITGTAEGFLVRDNTGAWSVTDEIDGGTF